MKRQGVAGNPGKGALTPGGPCPVCSASDAQGPLQTDLFKRKRGGGEGPQGEEQRKGGARISSRPPTKHGDDRQMDVGLHPPTQEAMT